MSDHSILDLLDAFFRSNTGFLPVIDREKKELKGVVSRGKLDQVAADASRISKRFEVIPDDLYLSPPFPPDLLNSFSLKPRIPVLYSDGLQDGQMESATVLSMLGRISQKNSAEMPPDVQSDRPELKLWLSNLLLGSLPFPLLACDLRGKALFYNGAFEKDILRLLKSVTATEKYFLELARTTLVRNAENVDSSDSFNGYLPDLKTSYQMVNLTENGKVVAYLFQFSTLTRLSDEILDMVKSGRSLEAVIAELERYIIVSVLSDTDYNISQSAGVLKTVRTTLQSRMKKLKIPLREVRSPKTKPSMKKNKGKATKTRAIVGKKQAPRKKTRTRL